VWLYFSVTVALKAVISWNFVNEIRLTEYFATSIIPLVIFHFNQLPLLRILTGENQDPSTLASTLARKKG